jgi:hypothetical protein
MAIVAATVTLTERSANMIWGRLLVSTPLPPTEMPAVTVQDAPLSPGRVSARRREHLRKFSNVSDGAGGGNAAGERTPPDGAQRTRGRKMPDREIHEREVVREGPGGGDSGVGAGVIIGVLVAAIVLVVVAIFVFGGLGNDDTNNDDGPIPNELDIDVDINDDTGGNGGGGGDGGGDTGGDTGGG